MEKSTDHLERELIEEKRKNALIRKVSEELGNISSLEEKLNNILQLLDNSFNLQHTVLFFPLKEKKRLRVFASRGFKNSGIGSEINYDQGIAGVVASKKKKLRVSFLTQYRRYAEAMAKTVKIPSDIPHLKKAESLVALPLIANDKLVAVLTCESENIQFFHQTDEDLLMTLSQQIALSIQNSIVFEELEERVADRTKKLEALNTSKDRLFSIIGHDLRSPLTSLESISELFEYYNKEGKKEKLSALGPKISEAAKNINQLLDNLLNWSLSQQEGIRCLPTQIEIYPLIQEVLLLFEAAIHSKGIKVDDQSKNGVAVYSDFTMSYSILRNLISNAIKFTPNNGKIEISTKEEDKMICISIKDSGAGICKENLKTLFQLKDKKSTLGTNRERGSGLGLVLVKEFVDLNNGLIEIESSASGTCVYLKLPKK